MISVVVPTLWKVPTFPKELRKLSSHNLVGEIILIDNTDVGITLDTIPKLVHIKEFRNTYVNPAWNKGVSLAKYEKILIMNDDVETDYGIIDKVYDIVTEQYGMIGAGKSCWYPFYQEGSECGLAYINHRPVCYASFFFIHKNSYKMIPSELKVWYGDDWLFTNTKKQNLEIRNWFIGGESGRTAMLSEFDEIRQQDLYHYREFSTDNDDE